MQLKNDYEPLSCVYSPSLSKLVKSMLHREPEVWTFGNFGCFNWCFKQVATNNRWNFEYFLVLCWILSQLKLKTTIIFTRVQKSLVESAPTNKLDAILSKWNKFDPKQLATHENENLHSMSTLLSASYVVVAVIFCDWCFRFFIFFYQELKYDENPELLFNDSFRISNLVTSESVRK